MTRCRPWTLHELRQIDAALDAGQLPNDIARALAPQLGRTVAAVALQTRRRRHLPSSAPRAPLRPWRAWTTHERRIVTSAAALNEPTGQAAARLAPRLRRSVDAIRQAIDDERARIRGHRPTRRRWTAEEIAEIRRMRAEGATWAEIGARFSVTRDAAFKAAQR